jgi:hypothetical protein
MFGYILPEKPELKIREYEIFRAYYCSVCKSIGKSSGLLPRLTLNYDLAFLAILLSSLSNEKVSVSAQRCIVHPVRKKACITGSKAVVYASDMNIILAYYNLEDKVRDSSSVFAESAKILLKPAFKKIRKKYAGKCAIIEGRLKELTSLEKSGCNSVDKAAEPFAKLMEEIIFEPDILPAVINECSDDNPESFENALRWLGYNIGKWIYLIDAFDDIESDIKKKIYNPFASQYAFTGPVEKTDSFIGSIRDKAEFLLTHTLSQIARAFELLDAYKNKSIVENIIYMGMLSKTEQILGIRSCNKIEKSV